LRKLPHKDHSIYRPQRKELWVQNQKEISWLVYSECSFEQYLLPFFIIASDSGMCVSQTIQATIFCPELELALLLSAGFIIFLKRTNPIQPSNITNINLINEKHL